MSSNDVITNELARRLVVEFARCVSRFPGGAEVNVRLDMTCESVAVNGLVCPMYVFEIFQTHADGTYRACARLSEHSIISLGEVEVCKMMARNLQHSLFRIITKLD